jgi:drug/metabolite transporter (DMT)-like permease
MKARDPLSSLDPGGGPVVTPRFVLAVLLLVVGIAWVVYFYVSVRADPTELTKKGTPVGPSGPKFMGDLDHWNYFIGFGLFLLGLVVAAHPSTPLGRGRGVVIGMLGCFLVGLLWICTYYVFSNNLTKVPVFNDLGQYNLMVGIAFMAVGFTYATRWE